MLTRPLRSLIASAVLGLFSAGAITGASTGASIGAVAGLFVLAAAPSSHAASQQDQIARIKDKAQRAKSGVIARNQAGQDVSSMIELMQQVKPNMDDGDYDEAESLLDQVLAMLDETGQADTTAPASTTGAAESGAAALEIIDIRGQPGPPGAFDPSIQYGRDGRTGWMVYSALGGTIRPSNPFVASTLLARSTDNGRSWTYVQTINSPIDTIQSVKGKELEGIFKYEVPTLVYHPEDRGREWKLFTHKMFWSPKGRKTAKVNGVTYAFKGNRHSAGWITYRYASDPAGDWSEEVELVSFPPGSPAAVDLRELSGDFRKVRGYSEPGSLSKDGVLYLSLSAYSRRKKDQFIFLIDSRDGGRTWNYVGKLLDMKDAKALGYDFLLASDMAEENGRVYLIVTPGDKKIPYRGAMVIRFDDLAGGTLRRDGDGKLIVVKHVEPAEYLSPRGAGPATYDAANTNGGIVMGQVAQSPSGPLRRLYDSRARIAD